MCSVSASVAEFLGGEWPRVLCSSFAKVLTDIKISCEFDYFKEAAGIQFVDLMFLACSWRTSFMYTDHYHLTIFLIARS